MTQRSLAGVRVVDFGQYIAGASQRLYAALGGWLFAAAEFGNAEFSVSTRADAVERLTRAGVAAHALTSIAELREDAWVTDRGLLITRMHDTGETITTLGPGVRLARTPVQPGQPAATPGIDARDVLRPLNRRQFIERTDLAAGALVATA